ncbi:IS256 family transposase [Apilactobacillus quenuiae]|uniref:IS256 family transposase n=1 Tax=Apilactobacillus quenuiae TaxID=2008377 RepID=UPI000D019006|nr:IS256 family transposase [Apilactobacillus quenuiae]
MDNSSYNVIKYFDKEIDVRESLRKTLEENINEYMKHELNHFLGYEKYNRSELKNYRNGSYKRKLVTRYGVLNLTIPRDRRGLFQSKVIHAYKRRTLDFDNIITSLYKKGMSTSEISEEIRQIYRKNYTPQTISNINKVFNKKVFSFKNRLFNDNYVVVYLDATYIKVRRKRVQKETVYLAIGVNSMGHREVLGYYTYYKESSDIWDKFLNSLRSRGLSNVILFVTDGLNGLSKVIKKNFTNALHQKCLIHTSRSILKIVSRKDRKLIINDFNKIYSIDSYNNGKNLLEKIVDDWSYKYKKIGSILNEHEDLLNWLLFPSSIRRSIYSNNMIESFNKKLKRQIKKREQFPNINSFERVLINVIYDYNNKNRKQVKNIFKQI